MIAFKKYFFIMLLLSQTLFSAKAPQLDIEEKEDTSAWHSVHHRMWKKEHTRYLQELTNMIESAKAYLKKQAQMPARDHHRAVIFDIDGTLLKDEMDWGAEESQVIPQMKALYDYAQSLNFSIFLMTARSPDDEAITEKELTAAHIDNYNTCLYMILTTHGSTPGSWKAAMRERLEQDLDVTIIATFDDNPEVLLFKESAGMTFLVPRIYPLLNQLLNEQDYEWEGT